MTARWKTIHARSQSATPTAAKRHRRRPPGTRVFRAPEPLDARGRVRDRGAQSDREDAFARRARENVRHGNEHRGAPDAKTGREGREDGHERATGARNRDAHRRVEPQAQRGAGERPDREEVAPRERDHADAPAPRRLTAEALRPPRAATS